MILNNYEKDDIIKAIRLLGLAETVEKKIEETSISWVTTYLDGYTRHQFIPCKGMAYYDIHKACSSKIDEIKMSMFNPDSFYFMKYIGINPKIVTIVVTAYSAVMLQLYTETRNNMNEYDYISVHLKDILLEFEPTYKIKTS